MARGIGTRVLIGGHELIIHGIKREDANTLVLEMRSGEQENKNVTAKSMEDPIEGDIIVLAVPYTAIAEIAEKYKSALSDKIVVDITNPVDFQTFQFLTPKGTSAAEEVARLLPESKVVKAFNTTFAGTLTLGEIAGEQLDVFVASDHEDAKQEVLKLANNGNLRGLDVGPLAHAKYLEGMQLIHMALQNSLDSNWLSTIKILK